MPNSVGGSSTPPAWSPGHSPLGTAVCLGLIRGARASRHGERVEGRAEEIADPGRRLLALWGLQLRGPAIASSVTGTIHARIELEERSRKSPLTRLEPRRTEALWSRIPQWV